jgi:hypothetical protein
MKPAIKTLLFLAVLTAMSGVAVTAGAGVGYMAGLPWGLLTGTCVVATVPGVVVALARVILGIPERPWLVYLWSLVALMGSLLMLAVNGQLQSGLNSRALALVMGLVFVAACLSVFVQSRLQPSEKH